jgi:hypothetical protein
MTRSKQSPLYEKVIGRLEKNGAIASSDISPSYFLNNESSEADKTLLRDFWTEAYMLSCLKHASFHSSAETAYDDTMSSLVISSNREVALDTVREILEGECALIGSDGTVINKCEGKTFRTAKCIGIPSQMNKQQLITVATLASTLLSNKSSPHPLVSKPTSQGSTWMEFVTSPVRKLSRGLSYAIDSVLGDDFTQKMKIHESSELDDVISSPIPTLNEMDEDDNTNAKKSERGIRNHSPISNTDGTISLDAIACSSRCLLAYTNQSEVEENFFVLRGNDGSVDRIMLRKNGCVEGSLKSFSHQSGKYFSKHDESIGLDNEDAAKLLSNVSDEEVNLLAQTLVASNHAVIDEETITLFPNVISHNYTQSKSDSALFQIHTARITIQHRMLRLAKDGKSAQQNAINAKRNGMTNLALIHMKRRKAALDELERCAALISNLDASELRLYRAQDDVQLVQTFSMLKNALQDIRLNSGMDETNVEELMLDIQEEMEATNLGSLCDGAIGPDVDEDELNEEFRQLELECARENVSVEVQESIAQEDNGEVQNMTSAVAETDANIGETSDAGVKKAPTSQKNDPVPLVEN